MVRHITTPSPQKHRLKGSSKAANTIHVEPTGPAGRPASLSIQKNGGDLPINQKLQTDFAVS